jgi:hypothetical protein
MKDRDVSTDMVARACVDMVNNVCGGKISLEEFSRRLEAQGGERIVLRPQPDSAEKPTPPGRVLNVDLVSEGCRLVRALGEGEISLEEFSRRQRCLFKDGSEPGKREVFFARGGVQFS